MNDYKNTVCNILDTYKCKNKKDILHMIPIIHNSRFMGYLVPVIFSYKREHPEFASFIYKWREENQSFFANRFKGSLEKTEHWIDNLLLARRDRILFMIYCIKKEYVGHIGLASFDFKQRSCEIDNVIKGKKDVNPGTMTFALNTIITWSKNKLNVNDIYLRVLSHNTHAINFYEKNGFEKQYDIPLFRVEHDDLIEWISMNGSAKGEPEYYYTYMKLCQ